MKTFNVPIVIESTKVVLTVESCCVARGGKEILICPFVRAHNKISYCNESYGINGDMKIAKNVLFENAVRLTNSCPMVNDRVNETTP